MSSSIEQPSITGHIINEAQNTMVNSGETATYSVYSPLNSGNYVAVNRITGVIEIVDTDPTAVIQYAVNNVGNGESVVIKPGKYHLGNSITMTNNTTISGSGTTSTILYAPVNMPAIIMNGNNISLHNIGLWHDDPNYTSSVLQMLNTYECVVDDIGFYDSGTYIGTGIEIKTELPNNLCSNNIIHTINLFGFQNAMLFTTADNGVIDTNFIHDCVFDGCQNVLATNAGTSSTAAYNVFSSIIAQNEVANPFTTAVYNFDDAATHWRTKFIGCNTFGIPGGVFAYAINNTTELGLIGTFPNDDANVSGSGAAYIIALGSLTRDYSPNNAETLFNKTLSSADNTLTLASPLTIGTTLLLSETGLTGARSFEFPDISDTVVTLTATQAMTNKELTDPKITNVNTGSTTALLATNNCPATTGTAPYAWMTFKSSDGSTVYVPAWK